MRHPSRMGRRLPGHDRQARQRSAVSETYRAGGHRLVIDRQTDAELRHDISVALGKVSYFHNIAAVGPGICRVCRGPALDSDVCPRCQSTEEALGGATCDHTFFLAYADGHNPGGCSQSAQTMRLYKDGLPPSSAWNTCTS